MRHISTLVARGKQAWTRSIAPRRTRPTFVGSNRIVLASLFALSAVCVLSAQANAADLPANSTEILSGTSSLLAPLSAPVSALSAVASASPPWLSKLAAPGSSRQRPARDI
jgi:hypothetical protein